MRPKLFGFFLGVFFSVSLLLLLDWGFEQLELEFHKHVINQHPIVIDQQIYFCEKARVSEL